MDNTTLAKTTQDLDTQSAKQIVATGNTNARELMHLVNKNGWVVNIKGKNYLQVEAWQTLGKFYGYTARTSDEGVKFVEYGTAKGFEAKAEIVIEKTGEVVGGATGICLDDEPNKKGWALYALSGMAQTRAISRAYRQMLSFVAVSAGFEPTPYEEMEAVDAGVIETPTKDELASDAQKSFLVKLNVEFDEQITKKQASDLISKTLAEKNEKKDPVTGAYYREHGNVNDDRNRILDDMAKDSWKGMEE